MKFRRDLELLHGVGAPRGRSGRVLVAILSISIAAALILSALMPGVSAMSGNWITMFVDSENDVGQFSSIAVDDLGEVHICYYDATQGRLMYAHTSEGAWEIMPGDTAGNVGQYSSIALDSNGSVHISYYDQTNHDLKYATNSGGFWSTAVIDNSDDVGQFTSIAIDSSDKVHISYYDSGNGDLKYATNKGGVWSTIAVDSEGNVGQFTSIAIDSGDKVHISYYDVSNKNLKYATNSLPSWFMSPLDSDGDVGLYTSIEVGVSGTLHISYYDASNKALKYASNPGGEWSTSTIDSEGDVGKYSSLALDPSGKPQISCIEVSLGELSFYSWTGTDWNNTVIEYGDVGMHTSIVADGDGNLHISYYDASRKDLKYAYSQNQLPSAPQDLSATGGDGYILLEWSLPADSGFTPVNHYNIYRGSSSLSLVLITTTNELSFNDSVANGHPYYYQVTAVNSYGEGAATEVVFAIPTASGVVPSAPQNLEVNSDGLWAQLTWDPPVNSGASPITNYIIYRGSDLSLNFYKELGLVTSYNDTEVANNHTYYYTVAAKNAGGEGERSNVVQVTPFTPVEPTVPSAPRNLTATPSADSITLHWDPPLDNGGSSITNYAIYRGTSPDSITLLTTVGNVLQYTHTSVESGKTYYYQVKAINGVGESPAASTSTSIGGGGIEIDPTILIIVIVVVIIIVAVVYLLMRRGGGGNQPQQQQKPWPPKERGKNKW